jgi:hypothetical protein
MCEMKNILHISVVAAFAFSSAAQAEESLKGSAAMDGPAIIKAFDGKTLKGVYADGTPVQETYLNGGKIDYWDPYRTTSGNWSVVNNLLCTFYENNEMSGACFKVVQVSTNCFDYFAAAGSEAEALTPVPGKPSYTARAHIVGLPDTCPEDLAV